MSWLGDAKRLDVDGTKSKKKIFEKFRNVERDWNA